MCTVPKGRVGTRVLGFAPPVVAMGSHQKRENSNDRKGPNPKEKDMY